MDDNIKNKEITDSNFHLKFWIVVFFIPIFFLFLFKTNGNLKLLSTVSLIKNFVIFIIYYFCSYIVFKFVSKRIFNKLNNLVSQSFKDFIVLIFSSVLSFFFALQMILPLSILAVIIECSTGYCSW